MSHRIEQVNELVKQEISHLLVSHLEMPLNSLVTVIDVETSRDLRHATVFISVLPISQTGTALKRLRAQIGILQFELNRKLRFKPLPRIRFVVDRTEATAAEVEEILNRSND